MQKYYWDFQKIFLIHMDRKIGSFPHPKTGLKDRQLVCKIAALAKRLN
jgi:hypothetical protein